MVAKYGRGKTGKDYFRGALELLHATYIGYHGYAHEWLADNPEFTREMLNRCGYWLFPISIEWQEPIAAGEKLPVVLTIENRGVAPPYHPYQLRIKLSSEEANLVVNIAQAEKTWLPGSPIVIRGEVLLPANLPPGVYSLALGLFDETPAGERTVEFALKAETRDAAGYYHVGNIRIGKP